MGKRSKFLEHWPTVFFGFIVGIILLIAVFSYQLSETEIALVTTLGKVEEYTPEPGLHFRWPYPFQEIIKYNKTRLCFEGNEGKVEETRIADGTNIMVGIFVIYSIDNAKTFYEENGTVAKAEEFLNSEMRSTKNAVFGKYRFDQLINIDSEKVKLPEIEKSICQQLQATSSRKGMMIHTVGINTLGQPSRITEEVLKRMVEERKLEAQTYLSEGNTEAQKIRIEADTQSRKIISDAEAQAKEIRAKGDSEAAQYYAVFKQNPELAIFLRKLESLRQIMKSKTTLVLDTNAAPFDLFKSDSDKLPSIK